MGDSDKRIIDKNNLIEKRNILNEMSPGHMDLQEIRFFSIYLSKINPRDLSTRVVDFPLSEFVKIMEIKKVNVSSVQGQLAKLLARVIFIPTDKEEYEGFQLFKKCVVYKDRVSNIWRVKIDAHDDALPLMFNFKERYFKYELWNALSLSSSNQIRMYEILKQYEKIGSRIINVDELKKMLGVERKKYKRFNNFREYVLDSAKKALAERTDICFEYETISKIGRKVTAIKFTIKGNKGYRQKLSLNDFIAQKKEPEIIEDIESAQDDRIGMFTDMFDNEFTHEQVEFLYQMAQPMIMKENKTNDFDIAMCNYFRLIYKRMKCAPSEIKFPFAYAKKLIAVDLEQFKEPY